MYVVLTSSDNTFEISFGPYSGVIVTHLIVLNKVMCTLLATTNLLHVYLVQGIWLTLKKKQALVIIETKSNFKGFE